MLARLYDVSKSYLESRISDKHLKIDNIIHGVSYYRISNYHKTLSDLSFYLVILSDGTSGFAYFNSSKIKNSGFSKYINSNILDVINNCKNHPLKVALIDALVGLYNKEKSLSPTELVNINGTYQEKAMARSVLVTRDIKKNDNVLLIGAVSEIAKQVLNKGASLSIADLSKEKKNTELYNINIINTIEKTLESLKESNIAIVTGATFSSNTINEILEISKNKRVKLRFYLETGNNFGPHLIAEGANLVVAEKFPFYDLPGVSSFEVYKHD